jgi:hypothetical protein
MPVTKQDLLEWTKEYSILRKNNPNLVDFNEWLKDRIVWKEDTTPTPPQHEHTTHTTTPVHTPAAHVEQKCSPKPVTTSTQQRAQSSVPTSSPLHHASPEPPLSQHAPSPTPSLLQQVPSPASPSPSLVPSHQEHIQHHTHPSSPILQPVPILRPPSTHSNTSTPIPPSRRSSNERHFSPTLSSPKPTQSTHQERQLFQKRRSKSPSQALVRSLSQIISNPLPQQMALKLAARNTKYGYSFNPVSPSPPPNSVEELKSYITQFQAKQQNQLFQIFDIVEDINNKLSRTPPPPPPPLIQPVAKVHPKPMSNKIGPPILHPSIKSKSSKKREPTLFAAMFRDQVRGMMERSIVN